MKFLALPVLLVTVLGIWAICRDIFSARRNGHYHNQINAMSLEQQLKLYERCGRHRNKPD
jgi:hypothetical protein